MAGHGGYGGVAVRNGPVLNIPVGLWAIGVSGGGDSVALLHMLVAAGQKPVVLHYNHMWSAWGDKAEALVTKLCGKYGLKLVVGKGKGRPATNAEAKAREERYAFFAKQVGKLKLEGVLVGHTQTDDVEGFFMRLARGSGVAGLAGMKEDNAVEGVRVVRPLLGYTRAELRAYLKTHQQTYVNDPSNRADDTFRARIRKVLPVLAKAGVEPQHVASSMASLHAANVALDITVQGLWKAHGRVERGRALFPRAVLLDQPQELAVRLVGILLQQSGQQQPLPRRQQCLAALVAIGAEGHGKRSLGRCFISWTSLRVVCERLS